MRFAKHHSVDSRKEPPRVFFTRQQKCLGSGDNILCFLFQDAFNSLVAAVFLIIVGLCATIIKTNSATLIGGVSKTSVLAVQCETSWAHPGGYLEARYPQIPVGGYQENRLYPSCRDAASQKSKVYLRILLSWRFISYMS